ncbi:hypothetical protein GCM10017688_52610 [Streptomyces ramulosus]
MARQAASRASAAPVWACPGADPVGFCRHRAGCARDEALVSRPGPGGGAVRGQVRRPYHPSQDGALHGRRPAGASPVVRAAAGAAGGAADL